MGEEYTITFTSYLFNALLIGDLAGIPSIDGANWTLVIEIKFYILCGVLSIFTNLRSKKVVLCVPLLMTIVCLLLCSNYDKLYSYNSILHKLAYIFSTNAMFIILMFTGICIYNYHQGNWRRKDFIILLILLVLFFIISVYCNPNSSQIDYLLVSNLMALITFMCCFLFRKKLKYNKYIDFFAKISYPLYVVHGKTGYITMYLVYNSVLANAYVAIFVALSLVILIAYLIHILIEVPSINFGRVVTSRLANFKT
jgi:peptidoglycan/LPS O-acetylase OafA/YrhL